MLFIALKRQDFVNKFAVEKLSEISLDPQLEPEPEPEPQ
jgi:hypothetical protein